MPYTLTRAESDFFPPISLVLVQIKVSAFLVLVQVFLFFFYLSRFSIFFFFLLLRMPQIAAFPAINRSIQKVKVNYKRKTVWCKLMVLQLLPQFFSLQYPSVNLSLSFVGMALSILHSGFHTGTVPCDVHTWWGSRMFPRHRSADTHYPISHSRQIISMHF